MKAWILTVAKAALSIGLIAWLVHHARQQGTFTPWADGRIPWEHLAIAGFLVLTAVMGSFVRWQRLVRALGIDFRLADAVRLGFVGYFCSFFSLGGVGGDLFKAVFVARERPRDKARVVASVVVDRLVGLYSLMVLALLAIAMNQLWRSPRVEARAAAWLTTIGTVVGGLGLAALLSPWVSTAWLARIPGFSAVERLVLAIRLYRHEGRCLAVAFAISLATHVLYVLSLQTIAQGLPGLIPTLAEQLVAAPLASLTGVIPLPLNGLGAFEGALDYLYVRLSDAPVPAGQGLLVALGFRLLSVGVAIVGAIYFALSRADVTAALEAARSEARPV